MKAIRKMVNGNKGFITFWLILFFLNAGFIRNFITSATPSTDKAEIAHHDTGAKHDLTATSDEDSGASFFDQFKKDADSDDVEFVFFGNFSSKTLTYSQDQHEFSEIGMHPDMYRIPLYDLYCNWKFHHA